MQIIYLISGILICQLIIYSSRFTFPLNQKYFKSFPPNFLMQIYFGICSIILMYIFGYELKFSIAWSDIWKIVYQVFLLFLVSFFIIITIINAIENKFSVGEPNEEKTFKPPPNQKIFLFMVMCINPITEELLYRGFLLNHILLLDYTLVENSFIILSLPIVLSGLYFGLSHLSLLKGGMNKYFVYNIVSSGVIVGTACGYYYIKYNSFSAAIIVHFMANVTGSFVFSLKQKLKK